ncbi:hypothetical protein [Limnofasciculus baicalensis]|uniref:Uncharacterized protein n=1 Tax=Limnofasciculus baicalensis BBK-W-15 TaxID=2699891 RepID=A0AAE3GNZ1_9CYAN|nr:hypothetical protein [Limnofasciculus baicalensis]MCP2727341.1 hypothetical protein [Limnofasciculus baicalensis BBK-W-15]
MAEPTLSIFGEGTTQDENFLNISKAGLAAKIAAIALSEGEDAAFTPSSINSTESIVACILMCLAAEMTQEKRTADKQNVQIVVTSSGKSLDALQAGEESLVFSYRIECYQPVNLPGLNPASY